MFHDSRVYIVYFCSLSILVRALPLLSFFFFFNDTATTEIYTLSLHDALPISAPGGRTRPGTTRRSRGRDRRSPGSRRSEEHTSELQSPCNLVCRLLLEKKKKRSSLVCQVL